MTPSANNAPRYPRRRRSIPRSTLIPVILLVYLAVMAYLGWPSYVAGLTSGLQYFGVIALTVFIIVLLHFNLKRRERRCARRLAEQETKNDADSIENNMPDSGHSEEKSAD